MVIKLSSTVAVSCRPRSGRAQERLGRASSSPPELTGHRGRTWQEWHGRVVGRVVVTRRNCIRKRLLQALVGGVLLVMGSETQQSRRGTHVCLVADGGYSIRRSGVLVIPFFSIYLTSVPP